MSIHAIKWAFRQNVQPSGAKFVLVCLAEHLNADGYCYPSQRTISEETGQSERAVRNHLTALEDAGFIRRERRQGNRGHRVADGFWLVGFKSLPAESAAGNSETLPEISAGREAVQPATVAARDEVLPAESAVPTGNKRQSLPAESAAPIYRSEPPVEPPMNPQPTAAGSVREEIAETATVDEPPPDVIATAEALALAPWMSASLADVTRQVQRSLGLVSAFDPRDGPLEAEKFALYHARKPPKSWYTAWLNWIRNAVRYEQEQQSRTVPNPGQSRGTGQAARTGGAMVGSTAAGVESDIQRRGYSYDEVARRRRESRLAGENQHTADGSKAAS